MSEPVPVDAARLVEFLDRPGLAVLLVSVHPRHTFSQALSQQLSAEHEDIALGAVSLVDLVTGRWSRGAVSAQRLSRLRRERRRRAPGLLPVSPGRDAGLGLRAADGR